MNYLLDRKSFYKNREKKNQPQNFWIIILILVLLFVVIFFFRSFSKINLAVFGPILKIESSFISRVDQSLSFFSSKKQLVVEREVLKEKVKQLEAGLIEAKLNQMDLSVLREFYNRPVPEKSFIAGKVISKPKHLLVDTFIVDTGKKEGLSLGNKVVSQAVLLGEVVLLSDEFAKVKLYSSPDSKLAVRIGELSVPAEITGKGGGNFTAKLPRGTEVLKDDLVVLLSGQLVGVVEEIKERDEDPFKTIFIRVPVNLKQLSWVEFYD